MIRLRLLHAGILDMAGTNRPGGSVETVACLLLRRICHQSNVLRSRHSSQFALYHSYYTVPLWRPNVPLHVVESRMPNTRRFQARAQSAPRLSRTRREDCLEYINNQDATTGRAGCRDKRAVFAALKICRSVAMGASGE